MPFTEEERRTAIRSCRYCPMCHHADLAATVLRRETWSPRGRGFTLFAVESGKLGWDADTADVMYKFSADGLSRQVCAGHINHDEMVIDARRQIVAAGAAPDAVAAVKSNIERAGNPWGATEPDLAKLSGARPRAKTVVYFGPWARIHRQSAVRACAELLRRAGVAFSCLEEEGDPGLLLHQLGLRDEAHEAARALEARIGKSEVVVLDADAWRVLKAGFGDFKPKVKARHVSEVLRGKLKLKRRPKKVAYHDPCALARFAPCLDAPRALIGTPMELPGSRELAVCSGECGGLPFTNPDLAREAARRRAAQAAGAEVLVTASPAAAHLLSAKELTEFLLECL